MPNIEEKSLICCVIWKKWFYYSLRKMEEKHSLRNMEEMFFFVAYILILRTYGGKFLSSLVHFA